MEVKHEVKAKNSSKPRELLHRGLQKGIEKAGKNIREAVELPKQEEKLQSESAYAVDKTEAAAKSVASNTYAMGRKLAFRQKNSKKIQQPKNIPEAEPPGENIPKTANCDEATSASYTVGVGVNLSESTARYVENNGINTADIKLRTKPDGPLAGSLIKNKAPAKLIKEKPDSKILDVTDKKTVWESPIHKVKPYMGISAENSVETANPPNMHKIKELSNGDIKTKAVAINKAAAKYRNEFENTEPLVGTPTGGSAVYTEKLAKNNIKTRANQALAKKANSDKMAKVGWEQGRKLAINNLSGNKVQQQLGDVNADEQIVGAVLPAAELSSVQEQPISDVTDVNSVNNLSGFEAQSFQQEVGRQQKIANIKTREYEKSRERAVNSVRESNSGSGTMSIKRTSKIS